MRKGIVIVGWMFMVWVMFWGTVQGLAFNSATHVYIVDNVYPFTFDKINLYYGSIVPDLSLYVDNLEDWPTAFEDTHHQFTKLPYVWWNLTQKTFAKGWQTHHEIWGADFHAHGTYPEYRGYVNLEAEQLMALFPTLNKELAHFAIEVAIDLLLVRYHEPDLGLKLLWAAKYRSQEDFNLLAKTFVTNHNRTDLETLTDAEDIFRDLIIHYATALALPDPLRMLALGDLGAQVAAEMGVTIDPRKVRWVLRVAMALCQNSRYMEIIQSAIDGIRSNPELIK